MQNILALSPRSRPRERLLSLGASALTTEELVSILLGTGTKNRPVHLVAQHVTKIFQRIPPSTVSISDLRKIDGLGQTKICILLAVIELSARFQDEQHVKLTSPGAISGYLQELHNARKEIIIGLYFNARFNLEHKEILAIGSMNQTILMPRDVFSPIKHRPIAYIILAHNHPSGESSPTADDIAFTKRMNDAAQLLGVELTDHLIFSKQGVYSMKEHGYLGSL